MPSNSFGKVLKVMPTVNHTNPTNFNDEIRGEGGRLFTAGIVAGGNVLHKNGEFPPRWKPKLNSGQLVWVNDGGK